MSSIRRLMRWPQLGVRYRDYLRLRMLPRRQPARVRFCGRVVHIADPIDFLTMVDHIFQRKIYDFVAGPAVRIIDGGANIGVASLRFAMRHPAAHITAFEPDPQLFALLQANLATFGFQQVEAVQAALWTHAGRLPFTPDGGLGGRLAQSANTARVQIPGVRLRDLLDDPIDLLKLDIEGAETVVLQDCADRLTNVRRLFVEYHGRPEAPETFPALLALLAGAGFRLFVQSEYGPEAPFLARPLRGGFDQQVAIFGIRDAAQ
ncbi:MAG: FkbM family methyltransferase [Oscillochloris sp.]|nr:FkbM family methyltransferase [Oscillochloris sp.]